MKHIVMKKSDGENVDQIDIFGTIGEDWWGDSTSMRDVLDAVRASTAKTMQININSGGGSIFEGMGMYDAIASSKAKTTARVIGFAGSMATIVMLAADAVEIVEGSLVMIHNPSSLAMGESKDLRKQADVLDKLRAGMVRIYTGKTGMEEDEIVAMMDDETWLDATEAKSLGLVDKIVGDDEEAKAALGSLDLTATAPAAKIPLRFAASLGGSVSQRRPAGKMEAIDPKEDSPVATTTDVKEALGLDADATDEEVLEAVQALAAAGEDDDEDGDEDTEDGDEPAEDDDADEEDDEEDGDGEAASTTSVPDGMVLVDADVLADLRGRAAGGEDAETAALAARREQIVAKAIREGRIPSAKEGKYLAALDKDPATFEVLLTASEADGGLAKGLIPLAEIGTSHSTESHDAGGAPVAYDSSLFPQLKSNPTTETE